MVKQTKIFFSYFVLPACLLFMVACAELYSAENTITGQLKLMLNKHEPVGLYVQFDLVEGRKVLKGNVIASSGFKKITEHPVNFSLAYQSEKINQKKQYRLFTTVVNDLETKGKIASMSLPVLTQRHPSTLSMVIQPLRDPIE